MGTSIHAWPWLQITQFNILWLNPEVESSFPPGLLDLIISHPTTTTLQLPSIPSSSKIIPPKTTAQLLKQQMQKDALEPITDRDDDGNTIAVGTAPEPLPQESDSFSEGDIEQAIQFLRLNVSCLYLIVGIPLEIF